MLESALISVVLGAGILSPPAAQSGPVYYAESQPVAGGAELVTVFARIDGGLSGTPGPDVPLLAVLRDSLGDNDPDNDRLRSVWILTSTRPTLWQRTASALSFGYFRTGSRHHAERVPSPALDLASPIRSVYSNLLGDGLQAIELDPLGAAVRSTTRTYRGNSSDYNKLQIFQALTNLDNVAADGDAGPALPPNELREIYARLSLSTRAFGGLVREQNLSRFYDKETGEQQETRGHDWELLRQRAELNGLYFQPLAIGPSSPSLALLWIARSDLAAPSPHSFDGQLLGITNPWTDAHLQHWTGYSETWYLDAENRPVSFDAAGARPVSMIPLALYSLDYPRVPFLLADFRRSLAPKGREIVDKGATGVVTGVLGFTRFGNPSFFAAEWLWTFVRSRHGAAANRTARLQAYSEAREFLAMDSSLDPGLRNALRVQLAHLSLNPRENGIAHESTLAREQYSRLVHYLDSPRAEVKLDRDRKKELESYARSPAARMFAWFGQKLSGGPSVNVNDDLSLRADLDAYRRAQSHERFLQQVLASGSRPDVVWDSDTIRKSVEALSADSHAGAEAPRLIGLLYARTDDTGIRDACWHALQVLNQRAVTAREAANVSISAHAQ